MSKMSHNEAASLRQAVAGRSRKTALQTANDVPLNETGGAKLSRVLKQMGKPFAIISAFTGDDKATNLKQTSALIGDLIGMGLGGTKLTGHWPDQHSGAVSIETSFFIPFRKNANFTNPAQFLQTMEDLGHKFDQQAIIVGDGKDIVLINMDGSEPFRLGDAATANEETIRGGFSRIKKRDFVFGDKADGAGLDPQKVVDEGMDWDDDYDDAPYASPPREFEDGARVIYTSLAGQSVPATVMGFTTARQAGKHSDVYDVALDREIDGGGLNKWGYADQLRAALNEFEGDPAKHASVAGGDLPPIDPEDGEEGGRRNGLVIVTDIIWDTDDEGLPTRVTIPIEELDEITWPSEYHDEEGKDWMGRIGDWLTQEVHSNLSNFDYKII
jgi:hypothetical protein